MKLIDKDALMETLGIADDCKDCRYLSPNFCGRENDFVVVCANITDAPTIDAVPVVRCRDCKHRYDDGYCEVWGDSFYYWEEFDEVPEDMFCGHGERRNDETAD